MQTTVLTDGQTVSYARIAAMPGLNSWGGPDRRHLAAIAVLAEQDRDAVLGAFADEVHFNLSLSERRALAAALMAPEFLAAAN